MLIFLMYKENDKISSSSGSSKCCIDIFVRLVPLFDKTKLRMIDNDLPYFILLNVMFLFEFFNDFIVPNKTYYFQFVYSLFKNFL